MKKLLFSALCWLSAMLSMSAVAQDSTSEQPTSKRSNYKACGITAGFVYREFDFSKSGVSALGGITEFDGFQVGISANPRFHESIIGIGMRTGLFYEQFWGKLETGDLTVNSTEHSVYVPLHGEARFNVGKQFSLFAFTGFGFDLGIYNKYDFETRGIEKKGIEKKTIDEIYDDDKIDQNRFNASFELGGGFQVWLLEFQVKTGFGLLNHAHKGADYKVHINKPLQLSASFRF